MTISATIKNSAAENSITVATEGSLKTINIPGKAAGGCSVNGGELLFLALATCCCNDLYREAAKRSMKIDAVEVCVSGHFGAEGEAGSNISYSVRLQSDHTKDEVQDLINYVDQIAEIHKTLRQGVAVTLQNH